MSDIKIKVQAFGRFLSNMVMPNIGAFIAWGFITALFIETGWTPVAAIGGFGEYAGKGIVGQYSQRRGHETQQVDRIWNCQLIYGKRKLLHVLLLSN